MIMELPKKVKLPFASIVDEQLIISRANGYRYGNYNKLIYALTYELRENSCVYCGSPLRRADITLDHRYAKCTGGIDITNNLFCCCFECNLKKANLSHKEYLYYRYISDSKEQKNIFLMNATKKREQSLKKHGFILPNKWVEIQNISSINCKKMKIVRSKKYCRKVEFYKKYKKMPSPIIVDKNNRLLNGLHMIILAKDVGIQEVPVVRLENVELI